MGKKPPHITSARGTLNLIYCLNHTARQTETNDTFFPWNVVRVCGLRYFSSSTSLAHLYNFAAICCLLKKNKSLPFKIIAGCQSGTVLLPAGRPVFKRILYLAWAGFSICWVRQRLKFFIPPGLYSEKAGTAQYLYIFWGDGERNFFCSFWFSEQTQGLHSVQWMPGYFFYPDTTFATVGYQENSEHSSTVLRNNVSRVWHEGIKDEHWLLCATGITYLLMSILYWI